VSVGVRGIGMCVGVDAGVSVGVDAGVSVGVGVESVGVQGKGHRGAERRARGGEYIGDHRYQYGQGNGERSGFW
jgi:hypothetical protein